MSKVEKVIHGDALDVLRTFESNSIDSVCCDPPYGLSKEPDISEVLTKWLAGEKYDHKHGGFMGKSWDSFVPHPDIWREVYRVLKPGGHALVFAGTRTQDLMTISLRLAGFEVRDVIQHIFFSGFPKGHNVSKAFKRRGKSDLAAKYEGFNTNLKPAHEPIIVVRKPLIDADTGRKLTVVDCVEKYGTGAINIDASRIGESGARNNGSKPREDGYAKNDIYGKYRPMERIDYGKGRFPANCITLDSDEFYSKYFNVSPAELSKKASKKDRNSDWKGEEINVGERNNDHPTVKPTDLMAWLVRLITPPNGIVLDPFAGSGSTLVAAKREGFGFIGVELTEEYIPIIEARVGVEAIKAETSEGQEKE